MQDPNSSKNQTIIYKPSAGAIAISPAYLTTASTNPWAFDDTMIARSESSALKSFVASVKLSEQLLRFIIAEFPNSVNDIMLAAIDHQELSNDFLESFYDALSIRAKRLMCIAQPLGVRFIERHIDLLDDEECVENICSFQKLTMRFIDIHADKLDWDKLSGGQRFTMPFIRKHADKISLNLLVRRGDLSDKTINAILSEFDCSCISAATWSAISWHYSLSESNILSNIDNIDFNSYNLKTRKFKNRSITAYRMLKYGF